jgi:hypothetical protein
MPQTIIPTTTMRRGELVQFFGVPTGLPNALGNFAWPEEYAERLETVSKEEEALMEAHDEWVQAHEDWEHLAPARDQEALEEAIRAGKPDPGTPNASAAERAEHVAWTKLKLMLDDAIASGLYKPVIAAYLSDHAAHLAEHELTRKKAHAEATRKAKELLAEVEDGSNAPGVASATMKEFLSARWLPDEDDHDTLLMAKDDDSDTRKRAILERNNAIIARWRREANGQPEPVHDPIASGLATELAAAAGYGSTEAKAELTRRRAASRTK